MCSAPISQYQQLPIRPPICSLCSSGSTPELWSSSSIFCFVIATLIEGGDRWWWGWGRRGTLVVSVEAAPPVVDSSSEASSDGEAKGHPDHRGELRCSPRSLVEKGRGDGIVGALGEVGDELDALGVDGPTRADRLHNITFSSGQKVKIARPFLPLCPTMKHSRRSSSAPAIKLSSFCKAVGPLSGPKRQKIVGQEVEDLARAPRSRRLCPPLSLP